MSNALFIVTYVQYKYDNKLRLDSQLTQLLVSTTLLSYSARH